MNNRIMAALFALTLCLCLFIGVVPVDAEAACGHTHVKTVYAKGATCTATGLSENYDVCQDCGTWLYHNTKNACTDHYKKNIVTPALGHNFIKDQNTKDATNHWEGCTRCGAKQNVTAHDRSKIEPAQNNTDKCKITCSCGYIYTADHVSDGLLHGEEGINYHWNECVNCKSRMNGIKHVQITVDNKDGKTHADKCKDCGLVLAAANEHVLKAVINADGTHTVSCDYCEYEATAAHVDVNSDCICDVKQCQGEVHDYTKHIPHSTNMTHILGCAKCNKQKPKETWQDCTFGEFESQANGTHKAKCSVCGYVSENELRCSANDDNADHICDDCGGRVGHIYTSTSYMEDVKKKGAKCEETGIKVDHRKCRICGLRLNDKNQVLTDEEVIIPALNHNYVWAKAQDNEHYQYCANKGCKAEVLSRGEHTFTYVSANNGYHTAKCDVCGYKGTTGYLCADVADDNKCECKCGYKMPHDTTNTRLVPAKVQTCTEDGHYDYRICDECGKTFAAGGTGALAEYTNFAIAKTGHNWQIQKNLSGMHVVKCINKNSNGAACKDEKIIGHEDNDGDCLCDAVEKNGSECAALIHDHTLVRVEGKAATCTAEGTKAYYKYLECDKAMLNEQNLSQTITAAELVIAKLPHTPGEWKNEGDDHSQFCDVCDTKIEGSTAAHVDDNGDNRCDVCKFELALEAVAEIPATCTKAGKKAHYISTVTGRSYWDAAGTQYISNVNDLIIDPLDHVGSSDWDANAAVGTHKKHCELCGADFQSGNCTSTYGCFCDTCGYEMPGHSATFVAAKAADCDTAGNRAYAKCCGKFYALDGDKVGEVVNYSSYLAIAPLGHDWNSDAVNDDAAGKHYVVCKRAGCGAKSYGTHQLTTTDPLSGNYHQMMCECGEVKLEKHYDKNGDNVCDDAGCKRDLSGKKLDISKHEGTTVVTGDPSNTNSAWSVVKNWLENMTPSNGGGSAKPDATSNPSNGGSSDEGSNVTPPSQSGSNNQVTPPSQGGSNQVTPPSQATEAAGVLQYIVSFFTWLFSGFGG